MIQLDANPLLNREKSENVSAYNLIKNKSAQNLIENDQSSNNFLSANLVHSGQQAPLEHTSRERYASRAILSFWPSDNSDYMARGECQSPRDSKAQTLFRDFVDKMMKLNLNTDCPEQRQLAEEVLERCDLLGQYSR